jgi:cytochrome P450
MSLLNELWNAALKEEDKLKSEFGNLRELLDLRVEHLITRPGLIRPIFSFLRKHEPIFKLPKLAIVSLYDDVVEVLNHETHFNTVPIYAKKMEQTTGDFVLGMTDTPQYQREMALMRQAVHLDDLAAIGTFANECAAQQIAAAQATRRIDVVAELTRRVPSRLVGQYFGVPGPDEPTQMRWMRAIFREIFLNLGHDPKTAQEGRAAAAEMKTYLNNFIAVRKTQIAQGQSVPDDFLCRLLKIQAASTEPIDDDVICRIVGGTIVGTVDSLSKVVAQALDQLLSRALALQEAKAAASANDDELLARYMYEALRFNPEAPFLIRSCAAPYTIAARTDRARSIAPGDMVLVGTESAMFDPRKFPEPDAFSINRPPENYLHFGRGLHACFGRQISHVVIPIIAKHLLRCPGLRRAPGVEGRLNYDGAFPNSWIVEFDAA